MLPKMYKIKRLSDGKYSTGGVRPTFTNNGKLWRVGPLKSHIALVKSSVENSRKYTRFGKVYDWPYKDCVVVECEITEKATYPLIESGIIL